MVKKKSAKPPSKISLFSLVSFWAMMPITGIAAFIFFVIAFAGYWPGLIAGPLFALMCYSMIKSYPDLHNLKSPGIKVMVASFAIFWATIALCFYGIFITLVLGPEALYLGAVLLISAYFALPVLLIVIFLLQAYTLVCRLTK